MSLSQAEGLGQSIRAIRPVRMGALPLVYPILTGLQVWQATNRLATSEADIDVGRVVVLLVLNRLLAPQPLYRVQDWLSETVLPEVLGVRPEQVYDNRLGRALDRLYPHLGELWAVLVSGAIQTYDLDLNVLHWDITSLYFEGAYADSELAAYGYSRDHRPDTKQVNLEVDVSHDGAVPVLYHTLAGNTADITRPLAHLQALQRFLTRPELAARNVRPVLVSDSKMVTAEAACAYHGQGVFYLAPLPNSIATESLLRSVSTAELAANSLAYRPQRVQAADPTFVPYQGVWRSYTFVHDDEQVTDRALVVWSAGKQRLDEQKRKTYLKRLLNNLEAVQQKLNTRRYKKRAYVEQRLTKLREGSPARKLVDVELGGEDEALTLSFHINRQQLAEAQALDGRYALVTDAAHLDATTALALFKGQDGVEKRFRTIKGPLLVRPLFVRNDHRIEGLVFISLVALLVRAILERACRQQGMSMTADRLFDAFSLLQAVDLMWEDGSIQRRAAEMTATQAQVLHALDWPAPETYATSTLLLR